MAKASRQAFGEAIALLGEKNENIVVLDADLSKSTQSKIFAAKFPDRFYEMGIQEANMIGVAAGMALSGKKPFICSFAVFITGRYDTIRMSLAYPKANVTIVGTHAGIGIGEDGNSQMGLEDVSIMRSLPNMIVLQPADEIETVEAIKFLTEYNGPAFLRLTRQKLDDVHGNDYKFEFGKADLLRQGSDVAIFASGGTVMHAVKAAEILEKEGVKASVVNFPTIKPIDKDFIVKTAKETGNIVTVEDHNIIGGLGSAVAEALAESGISVKFKRFGINDTFGESGTPEDLYAKYGLDAEGIKNSVKNFLK